MQIGAIFKNVNLGTYMKKLTMAQKQFYSRVIAGENNESNNGLIMRAVMYAAATAGMITYIQLFT